MRGATSLLVLVCSGCSLLVSGGNGEADAAPPSELCPSNWSRAMQLTFDARFEDLTSLEGDVENVPVAVVLDEDMKADLFLGDGLEDLRFADSDGNRLPYEIESAGAPGQPAFVWVRVPRIAGGTVTDYILAFGGNEDPGPTDEYAPDVWEGVYSAVWHLSDDPAALAYADSTGHGNQGVANPAANYLPADGQIAGAVSADNEVNTDAQIEVPSSLDVDLRASLTVEGWVYLTRKVSNRVHVIQMDNPADSETGFDLRSQGTDDNHPEMKISIENIDTDAESSRELALNEWHHLAGVFDMDAGQVRIYVDGRPAGSASIPAPQMGQPLDAGSGVTFADRLVGRLDEIRIATFAHAASWIAIQHKSMALDLINPSPAEDCR